MLEIRADFSLDATEFERFVTDHGWAEAVELYHGDFLAGFKRAESPEFQAWVESKRRDLKRLFHRAVNEEISRSATAAHWNSALTSASRWVEIDPLDDEANHALIDMLIEAGERTQAIQHFAAYETRIRDELNARPLDKTLALIEQIRAGTHPIERTREADVAASEAMPSTAGRLIGELTRRRVLRMAGWYAASLFVVLQSIQALQQALYLPPWILTVTALLGMVGFPIALLLSWQFDLTPEGILRTDASRPGGTRRLSRGDWRVVTTSMILIVGSTVAAFSTSTVRGLLAGDRTPALVCSDGSLAPCKNAVAIEANRFVVLPFAHREAQDSGLLDGEIGARLLSEGLSHWQDINVAEQLRLNEALRRLPPDVRRQIPVNVGVAIAREVGAGKLIMGELWRYGSITRLEAVLYDVATGRRLQSGQQQFQSATIDATTTLYNLAHTLVAQNAALSVTTPVATATRSYAALLSYDSAWKALRHWDLDKATSHFTAALERDPEYAYAHLWLAYVMLWQGDTTPKWRFHADRARDHPQWLGHSEQLLARGIAALATKRFADACAAYRELLARDSASFYAWYGLSECLASDNRIVRDSTSPSGWSFASSYEEAIRAQQRALTLVPSFNEASVSLGSSRFATLLFLTPAKYRSGVVSGPAPAYFAARPELLHDTIGFVPQPHEQWRSRPVPPTNVAVITRHRVILRQVATAWAGAYPNNTRALEALASALEQTGEIARGTSSKNTALDVIRRARLLETDAQRKLRLAVVEIRLLFKTGRFRDARALALTTLKKHEAENADDASRLAGVAGLIGKPHMMARLLVQAADEFDYDRPVSGEDVQVPGELARVTAALLGYAYVGVPVDSSRVLLQRAHAILDRSSALQERAVLHSATLDRAARILYPVLGPDEVHKSASPGQLLLRIQSQLWRRDTAAARAALAELRVLQQNVRPTDAAADGVLTQAQLYLALSDTTHAAEILDAYLTDLQAVPPSHFRQPYQPVSIVRLMQMRAELAARSNDRAVARKWARAVVDLWENSDPELKPVVRRLRSLARAGS